MESVDILLSVALSSKCCVFSFAVYGHFFIFDVKLRNLGIYFWFQTYHHPMMQWRVSGNLFSIAQVNRVI